MEMTFYDDSQFQSGSKSLKRPSSLALDSPSKSKKFNCILTSPDLNMLKLGTPEIERIIRGGLPTPTTQNPGLFNKNVTEEQENYAKGFLDALNHLHQSVDISGNSAPNGAKLYTGLLPVCYLQGTPAPASVIMSPKSTNGGGGGVLMTLNPRPPSVDSNISSCSNSNSMSVPLEFTTIKEEFQTVPSDFSSPPLSPIGKPQPIDMADQERIKLERKRHRNRIAASKCRKRKLEKISQLEDKVKELKGENAKLEAFADSLRDQVYSLKQTVLDHVKKGCQIMVHQTL